MRKPPKAPSLRTCSNGASASQAECRRFESDRALHISTRVRSSTRVPGRGTPDDILGGLGGWEAPQRTSVDTDLPVLGYGEQQLADLQSSIEKVDGDPRLAALFTDRFSKVGS